MVERIAANLPARSFDETERFYASLGFERIFRDDGWMILARGSLDTRSGERPTGHRPTQSLPGAG